MRVLVLGGSGFIGCHLTRALVQRGHTVTSIDVRSPRNALSEVLHIQADMVECLDLVYDGQYDVVVPLAAIATPAQYVQDPLRVFELDFEDNLSVIRAAASAGVRVVFPSTSEVYGKCRDDVFHPEHSDLSYGPINQTRWIYGCAKQLLDRVIFAMGQRGLKFSIFRPFNWVGTGMDDISLGGAGNSRVLTQFVGNAIRNEPLVLVNGGRQQRCFLHVLDGVDAVVTLIESPSTMRIHNIGNPLAEMSVQELAKLVLYIVPSQSKIVDRTGQEVYGQGYADIERRVPYISDTIRDLGWQPHRTITQAIREIAEEAACTL